MKDKQIIELLRKGKNQKAFQKLYSGYQPIKKLILSKGGTKADAEDIFQESLIVFCKKVQSPEFVLTSSISTYVYSIARFLWKDAQKKKGLKYSEYEVDNIKLENELEEIAQREKKFQVVEEVLNSIGNKCLKILQLFYYKGLSMKEIARQVDLKSEKVAKNQKYKCLERARKRVQEIQINNA